MEHRLHPRIDAECRAWVQMDGLPSLPTTAANISVDGALLSLTHPTLTPNSLVQLSVSDPGSNAIFISRAIVIHVSRRGTGFLLLHPLPKHFASSVAETPRLAS